MIINGIDDLDDDKGSRTSGRKRVVSRYFPEASVRVYDSFDSERDFIDNGYVYRKAQDILGDLQTSWRDTPEVRFPVRALTPFRRQ